MNPAPDLRPRLLLVDDEPTNLQVLRHILQADYRLLFATDGERALQVAREQRPDLVLLDIMMPHLDGYAVCRLLKADAKLCDAAILFVTAHTQTENEVQALEQGAIDLLLSVAMALLDFPSVQARRPPLAAAIRQRALHAPVPRRDASRWPPLPSPQHRQGTVALAGELPRDNRTALDFSFAQARQRLTPSQRMRLAAFKVATPPTLPQPVLNGPRRGLYLIENHWYWYKYCNTCTLN